jgi:tetratricopeptide (TPR) repeat protein
METVRKTLLLLVFSCMACITNGQDSKTIIMAFGESYAFEADASYKDAIGSLKAVYDPASYHINLRLGWLHYISGDFTGSAAYYQRAIELKPYAIEARFGLTYPASSLGNYAMVKEQYIKILEVDPLNTVANYYFGLMHYETGDFEMAAILFGKVVNLYPYDEASLLMYAWSKFRLGKLREAEVLFNTVLMIDPENESAAEGLDLIK